MAKNESTVTTVLSALSSATQQAVEEHFRQQFVAELSGRLAAPRRKAEKAESPVSASKRVVHRQMTNENPPRSASAWIRAQDPALDAKAVCELASTVGLDLDPANTNNVMLVYNVRNKAAKADPAAEPKKRGRPKKADVAEPPAPAAEPKKRGRPKKAEPEVKAEAAPSKKAAKKAAA